MNNPLVTVVCLCYNHERFVREALDSVFRQTYEPLELIIVDDASADQSAYTIREAIAGRRGVQFIEHRRNTGNCKAFNEAYRLSKGEFIIDLAADDALEPERVEVGVKALQKNPDAGVHYCDAYLMAEGGTILGAHFKRDKSGKLVKTPPEGMIYRELLGRYIICPPTMMYTRKVLDALDGYDENLSYEDFDFLVRSSRNFKYTFTDRVLVRKRIVNGSMSAGQYAPGSKAPLSTFRICEKAFELNETEDENRALIRRIFYELRQCILGGHYEAAENFLLLLKRMKVKNWQRALYAFLYRLKRK